MKFILFLIAAFAVYAIIENKFLLTVRHENLGGGVRIAHISDIHKRRFGSGNSRICEKVRQEKPDMIFVTGDLISRYETDLSMAEATLKGLSDIAPVYMIFGNHEQDISGRLKAELSAIAGKCGVVLLRNDSAKVTVKGRRFTVCGLEESLEVYIVNGSYKNLKELKKADVTELIGDRPEGEVLLLAHNPFFGEAYAEWGADYTFSGHVHGGVVRLFGIAMLSPERKFFPKNAKGVYDLGGKKLLVSAGLGKLRLFNPPEIVIYDI